MATGDLEQASDGRRTTKQLHMQTYTGTGKGTDTCTDIQAWVKQTDTCTDVQAWVKQTQKLTETVCLRALDVSSDSSWIE